MMIDSLLDSGVTLLELIVWVRNAPEVSVRFFLTPYKLVHSRLELCDVLTFNPRSVAGYDWCFLLLDFK